MCWSCLSLALNNSVFRDFLLVVWNRQPGSIYSIETSRCCISGLPAFRAACSTVTHNPIHTSLSEITLCIYLYVELLSVSPAYKLQEGSVCNLPSLPFRYPEQGLMYIRCSINTDGNNKGVMVILWKHKRRNSSLCIRIRNI